MAAVLRIPVQPHISQAPVLRVIEGGRAAGDPERVGAVSMVRNGSVVHPKAVYRRRRLVVALAVLALAVVMFGLLGAITPAQAAVASSEPAALEADGTYLVRPGDTLWSIARSMTDGDPRPMVDQLVDLNGGTQVYPGQRLTVG